MSERCPNCDREDCPTLTMPWPNPDGDAWRMGPHPDALTVPDVPPAWWGERARFLQNCGPCGMTPGELRLWAREDCFDHRVDWRTRCLAAEAECERWKVRCLNAEARIAAAHDAADDCCDETAEYITNALDGATLTAPAKPAPEPTVRIMARGDIPPDVIAMTGDGGKTWVAHRFAPSTQEAYPVASVCGGKGTKATDAADAAQEEK